MAQIEGYLKRLDDQIKQIQSMLSFQKGVLTLEEAALYSGFTKSSLYKLTSLRLIPHSKPGGKKIIFDKKLLDEWLLSNPVRRREELNSKAISSILLGKKKASPNH